MQNIVKNSNVVAEMPVMKNNELIIDIHVLNSVMPNIVPQDKIGRISHFLYGGVQRLMVPSNEVEKAVYKRFNENMDSEDDPSVETILFGDIHNPDKTHEKEKASCIECSFSTNAAKYQETMVKDYDDYNGQILTTKEFLTDEAIFYSFASLNVKKIAESCTKYIPAVLKYIDSFKSSASHSDLFRDRYWTPPSMIYIAVRNDASVSMKDAFQQPVVPAVGEGLIKPSIEQFVAYAKNLYERSHVEPDLALGLATGYDMDGLIEKQPCKTILKTLKEYISKNI